MIMRIQNVVIFVVFQLLLFFSMIYVNGGDLNSPTARTEFRAGSITDVKDFRFPVEYAGPEIEDDEVFQSYGNIEIATASKFDYIKNLGKYDLNQDRNTNDNDHSSILDRLTGDNIKSNRSVASNLLETQNGVNVSSAGNKSMNPSFLEIQNGVNASSAGNDSINPSFLEIQNSDHIGINDSKYLKTFMNLTNTFPSSNNSKNLSISMDEADTFSKSSDSSELEQNVLKTDIHVVKTNPRCYDDFDRKINRFFDKRPFNRLHEIKREKRRNKRSLDIQYDRFKLITDEKSLCYREFEKHFQNTLEHQHYIRRLSLIRKDTTIKSIFHQYLRYLKTLNLDPVRELVIDELVIAGNKTVNLFIEFPINRGMNLIYPARKQLCLYYIEFVLESLSKLSFVLDLTDNIQLHNTFRTRAFDEVEFPVFKSSLNFLILSRDTYYPLELILKRDSIIEEMVHFEKVLIEYEKTILWDKERLEQKVFDILESNIRESEQNLNFDLIDDIVETTNVKNFFFYNTKSVKNVLYKDFYILMVAYKDQDTGYDKYYINFF